MGAVYKMFGLMVKGLLLTNIASLVLKHTSLSMVGHNDKLSFAWDSTKNVRRMQKSNNGHKWCTHLMVMHKHRGYQRPTRI